MRFGTDHMTDSKPKARNIFDEIASWISSREKSGEKTRRAHLAQWFAYLGTAFALLQLLLSTLDVANRAAKSFLSWAPYLIPILFAGGAAVSVYYIVTASTRVQKRRAGGALALIMLVGLGWGGWTIYKYTRPPKAVIVLVADFERSPQATKGVDWGHHIYTRVKDQVDKLNLGERVDVQRVFEAYQSSEEAREAGEAHKATIVLWGFYDDVLVSPSFELLRTAEKFEPTLPAPPQDMSEFEVYIHSGPQEMAYVVSVALGLVYYADHNYAAAEDLFSAAVASAPAGPTLLGREVSHFFRANTRFLGYKRSIRPVDDIVEDLQQAITLKDDFWQAYWNLALAYSDHCTPTLTLDASLAAAWQVVELEPMRADAYWLLGQIHAEREEWTEAETAYERALRLDPDHADAYEGLGQVLETLGRSGEAEAWYRRALELRRAALDDKQTTREAVSPGQLAIAQDELGYAHLHAGQYDSAIAAFEEALELDPQNATFHRHLGNALYWEGKPEAASPSSQLDLAIAEYEAARGIDPDDGLLLTVLGGAYEEAGRPEDALQVYETAVAAAPCDHEALFLLASQYDRLGRSADAEAAFRRLVELNPKQAAAWHWLATASFLRDDYASAIESYQDGLALAPNDGDMLYGLAVSLHRVGQYPAAEAAYRQADQSSPNDPTLLSGWGDSLRQLGRTDEAIAAYEKASEISPDYPTSISLGLLYEQGGRLEDALRSYQQAVEAMPEDAMAHAAAGRVLQLLLRFDEGVVELEKAVDLEPDSPYYWESLMLGYAALNRLDEAFDAAERTLALNPQSVMGHLVRAGIYEKRGENDKAREEYQQVRRLAVDNAALQRVAQEALARLGE
jgi:tetratricopeptide (TPR) repeat protein